MKLLFNGHLTTNYLKMYMSKWKRAAVVLVVLWIVVTHLVISPLRCSGSSDEVQEYQEKLTALTSQLEILRHQHSNLISHIRKISNGEINTSGLISDGPSESYENLRRRIYSNTKELWYYVSYELNKLKRDDNKVQAILAQVAERKRSLLSDQWQLPILNGYEEWRKNEAANVSDLVQRRLKFLQNPQDCKEARKVVCNPNKRCGFGCQLHHIVYCMIFAYATERTLILKSKSWRYGTISWDYVSYPVSDSCTSSLSDRVVPWSVSHDPKVVSLPFIDIVSEKPEFLPLAIPKDLAHRITRFNGDPASWWIGQMVKFILRPRPTLQRAINETIAKIAFKTPIVGSLLQRAINGIIAKISFKRRRARQQKSAIVGVHIRRTDKVGTEAAFHHIDEYMARVDDYYSQRELTEPTIGRRRVYLASDDPNVLQDARQKYPQYKFLGGPPITKIAPRHTSLSLTGLLVDIHMLSMCDYIVCTFSSQVGRVAYEIMQTNRVDASESFFSLDDIYYFGGQNPHSRIAVMPHKPTGSKNNETISLTVGRVAYDIMQNNRVGATESFFPLDDISYYGGLNPHNPPVMRHPSSIHPHNLKEISLEVGDLIEVAGNHWNGFGLGTNRRTKQIGLIPWYKTADHLVLYPFPEYKRVPLYSDKRQKDSYGWTNTEFYVASPKTLRSNCSVRETGNGRPISLLVPPSTSP